ncbi:MAG: hypothetical protein P1P87_07265 [Trueperaceae bacterium]|nr:hypothetical protein [Trueperaceae bacterium]
MTTPTPAERPTAAPSDPDALHAQLARLSAQLEEVVTETRRARERWEVLDELVTDATPVMRQFMGSTTERLDAMDLRRALEFAGAGMGVVDRIVNAFDRQDVEALGENVVLMLQVVREMTQPEILGLLRQTATWAHEHPAPAEPPTLLSLAARLRKPEVRAGLDRVLSLLEGAVRSAGHPDATTAKEGPA